MDAALRLTTSFCVTAEKLRQAVIPSPGGNGVQQDALVMLLNSLGLFPPDDTASNLDTGTPGKPNFPESGHGSIKLTVLFDDPQTRNGRPVVSSLLLRHALDGRDKAAISEFRLVRRFPPWYCLI
jgi:hypothetical protein